MARLRSAELVEAVEGNVVKIRALTITVLLVAVTAVGAPACGGSDGGAAEDATTTTANPADATLEAFCADWTARAIDLSAFEVDDVTDLEQLRDSLRSMRYPKDLEDDALAVDDALQRAIDLIGPNATPTETKERFAAASENPDIGPGIAASQGIATYADKNC